MLLGLVLSPILAIATLVVGPDAPYHSIADALAGANDGDIVEVHGGVYDGPLVVDRPVAIVGLDGAMVDGHGRGTVVTVTASGAVVRGLTVRSSGRDLNDGDAGIEVRDARAVVEGNRLEDVLFGISLDNAGGSTVRGNTVAGKALPIAERGDGIRLWYSSDVLLEDNTVRDTRDCVVWYSARLHMARNVVERQRYGLHFMYDDDAEIVDNVLRDNSVGAYLMYSKGVTLRGNLFAANRGPSGYGLGLKDVDDVLAEGNWLVDNRVGAWLDNSPRSIDAQSRFHGNLFAFNDAGITLQPSLKRNVFWENAFQDNLEQVAVQGGGAVSGNTWSVDGRGNFWSDYQGFDANGDGVGDLPYRAEAPLDAWMDRVPQVRLFQLGWAANLVDFAARAFPVLRPSPKLVDAAPLIAPPPIPAPPFDAAVDPRPGMAAGVGLLALALGILALVRARPISTSSRRTLYLDQEPAMTTPADAPTEAPSRLETPTLEVSGLRRRFREHVAVDGLSFDVEAGTAVALWGPNGAGKTTVLRCILGLLPHDGDVRVVGRDARRHGTEARRAVGYVPQEVALHDDLSVVETAAFFAALRRLPPGRGEDLLGQLGLGDHRDKAVGALSGGLRQRLALGLALLGDPALLVLDEPTSNLDAEAREQVLTVLLAQRERGTALLFASHRVEEVEALADRVLVLDHGRLAFECPPRELGRRLGRDFGLQLRVACEQRDPALALLRSAGLTAVGRNGQVIGVTAPSSDKALPIRILERAGIRVADFAVEEQVRPVETHEGTRELVCRE